MARSMARPGAWAPLEGSASPLEQARARLPAAAAPAETPEPDNEQAGWRAIYRCQKGYQP
jgi:hypothetical protein